MSGRILAGGLVLFALIFGAALWWFQTRGFYEETVRSEVIIAGAAIPVTGYRGIDADTSPLKLRSCFIADPIAGPAPEAPEPLVAPGWFDCFDAEAIDADLASGAARAVLAAFNAPYGFDRIIVQYPDGRAYQWRQINKCGKAAFDGDPLPEGCPPKASAEED